MNTQSCARRADRALRAACVWAGALALACSAEPSADAEALAGSGGGAGAPSSGAGASTGGASGGGAGVSGGGAAPGAGSGATSGSAGHAGGSTRASFATVREMVQLVCGDSSCHGGEHALFLRDDDKLYSTLTTYVSSGCGGRVLVKPGAPDESAFSLVLQGACGTVPRMPNGCVDGQTCIPADYIEGVRQWIASGAPL